MHERPGRSADAPRDAPAAGRIVVPAHAKTNLRLRVLGRTADGYHGVETLFLRLGLHDEVELDLACGGDAPDLAVSVVDEPAWPGRDPTPEGPDNLCWHAAELFFGALDRTPSVAVRLRKRIPPGAGLGGGSADAAAVLRGLDRLHGGVLGEGRLLRLAGELGSDAPFCLTGIPMALGWERGRRLLPLRPLPPRPVLVLVPPVSVATADAYRWLDARRSGSGWRPTAVRLPPPDALADWSTAGAWAVNDFEDVVFDRRPEVEEAAAWLEARGAVRVRLSGSGSAVIGYFDDEGSRDAARARLGRADGVVGLGTEAPDGG